MVAEEFAFPFDKVSVTPTKRGLEIYEEELDASACSEFPLLLTGSWKLKETIERVKKQLERRPYNPSSAVTANHLRANSRNYKIAVEGWKQVCLRIV